jgi:beta-xylosidase
MTSELRMARQQLASRRSNFGRRRVLGVMAIVAAVLLLVASAVVLVQVLRTTPCDNVHFGSASGPVKPSSQPPPIGRLGIVRTLRQFVRGGSAAVFCNDFPDPSVLRVGDSYYAYATNTASYNVPVLATHGLFGTGGRREALPKLPRWATRGWTFHPSVLTHGHDYVLYYSARVTTSGGSCLSVAFATSPVGPFIDHSAAPLVCPLDGALDPSVFVAASGQAFLVWKNNTSIVSQPLSADGGSLIGTPSELLTATQPWQDGSVEGPSMVGFAGRYYLFYAGNHWQTASYAIGYATCATPTGPCVDAPGPWLTSGTGVQGPGAPGFFTDPSGQLWMSLAAWLNNHVGYPRSGRALFVLKITFPDGAPVAG